MNKRIDVVLNANATDLPKNSKPILNTGHFYQNLLCCLSDSINYPPVADLLRQYHHLSGQWLIVSPIHWQATHNDVVLAAADATLALSADTSRAFFAVLDDFVREENMHLYYHDAHTWLMRADERASIHARPVHQLLYQSLATQLQTLDTTLFWQRFLTEIQMLFSSHPINKTRQADEVINGVWIWGGGALPLPVQRTILCDTDEMCNLAQVLSTNVGYYQSAKSIDRNALLLFNEYIDVRALSQHLKKNTVRWYWNNAAYITKPKYWLNWLKG
jgi:hypothetical protein